MSARLPDISTLIQAGIDPRTGLPRKMTSTSEGNIKPNIKHLLRIVDEQDAINRYTWYNLPNGLDGQMIERILYYKGQAMFFYMESSKTFYFLPYALSGTIDVYGRFMGVTPLPFGNGTIGSNGDKEQKPWIEGLIKKPTYEVLEDDPTREQISENCVLLSDFSKQWGQLNTPRQALQDPIIDVMAECIPFLRTALINSTGVDGMRVNDDDQAASARLASRTIIDAALNGEKWIPINAPLELQELGNAKSAQVAEFLEAMQALDNFRLSMYGVDNGGLFQKKTYQTDSQNSLNQSNIGLVYQDGLTLRQRFCDIVNSIWDLGIYCEPSETILGYDADQDGVVADMQDQSGEMEGVQPEIIGGEE